MYRFVSTRSYNTFPHIDMCIFVLACFYVYHLLFTCLHFLKYFAGPKPCLMILIYHNKANNDSLAQTRRCTIYFQNSSLPLTVVLVLRHDYLGCIPMTSKRDRHRIKMSRNAIIKHRMCIEVLYAVTLTWIPDSRMTEHRIVCGNLYRQTGSQI